jgi:hypothetical protein
MAMVFIVSLSACKKDREAPSPAATILGKWYLKRYHTRTFRNNLSIRDTSRSNYKANDFEMFNADGSGYTSSNTPSGETAVILYNYKLSGNQLAINRDTPAFYTGTYTITLLTDDSLKVSYESMLIVSGEHFRGIDDVTFSRK